MSRASEEKQELAEEMTFWEHLEELRWVLFRCAGMLVIWMIVGFVCMPKWFDSIILAPCHGDFILYKWIASLNSYIKILPDYGGEDYSVHLQNIKLASQFFIHLSSSFYFALVMSFPFLLYQVWKFVAPALYEEEKRNIHGAFLMGSLLFFTGICVGYFVVFPVTLRFLSEYRVSDAVENIISLDSYISNFTMLILVMGLVFELPLLSLILSRLGLLHKQFFHDYRRHAIVATLILAAFITPSSDPFTLSVVFIPLYILWELSALCVK